MLTVVKTLIRLNQFEDCSLLYCFYCITLWFGCTSEPSCSKLTTLLVNIFIQISNINIWNTPICFVEKMWKAFALQNLLSFSQQNYHCIWNIIVKHLTSLHLNKLVKLTMLWTTGPRVFQNDPKYLNQSWNSDMPWSFPSKKKKKKNMKICICPFTWSKSVIQNGSRFFGLF